MYNVPGVPKTTKLVIDRKTLVKIFTGDVTTWDHPEIQSLNQGITLPSKPILVITRNYSNGPSLVLSDGFNKIDPLRWPTSQVYQPFRNGRTRI